MSYPKNTITKRVLEFVQATGATSSPEVAAHFRRTPDWARKMLSGLRAEGYLTSVPPPPVVYRYEITERGLKNIERPQSYSPEALEALRQKRRDAADALREKTELRMRAETQVQVALSGKIPNSVFAQVAR